MILVVLEMNAESYMPAHENIFTASRDLLKCIQFDLLINLLAC